MKFDPLDANQAVERSNSMPDETPIWIRLQGILGNEGEFAEQFLPVVRNWVKTEVAKTSAVSLTSMICRSRCS